MDLIEFPGKRPRPAAAYRLHRFASDGRVQDTVFILARDDTDARRRARKVSRGLRADLWSNGRFLEHIPHAQQPVAASIRLLDDQTPPGSR